MKLNKIFLLILFANSSYSQDTPVFEYYNSELFRGSSVVFTKEYEPPISVNSGTLFTPTAKDIEIAEQIFIERYNHDLTDLIWYKYEKDVRKKYWKYNRQYLGYIDHLGHKNLIINLLNFHCKKKATQKFEGWKEFYFVGFGEYYEQNSIRFIVGIYDHRIRLK